MERRPIVTPDMLPGEDGGNINGPSLIRVPDWLPDRLGRYYLYFAHHAGTYIRMAYADALEGPWTIHEPGTLRLSDAPGCRDHIASPDVHLDHQARTIRLYFHGVERGASRQSTFLAQSRDGIRFTAETAPIADFYLRVVRWRGGWLGMAKGGVVYLSSDGLGGFRRLREPAFTMRSPLGNARGDVRHVALDCDGDRLRVYFTRIGDSPEHVRMGEIDLGRPVDEWRVLGERPVLAPQAAWEGADLPLAPSRAGASPAPENALRDPAVFREDDAFYLLYSFAGEAGIGLTRIADPRDRDAGAFAAEQDNGATGQQTSFRIAKADALAERLAWLRGPGRLQERLAAMDAQGPANHIYLMGCGRSGTWLLTSLMSGFADTAVVAKELPVEYFGVAKPQAGNLVLKRSWQAFRGVQAIPDRIRILHIIRHPFAVLTSFNPMVPRKYYISPERWIGEMTALKYLIDSGRPHVQVVRYEDLVTDPARVQAEIGRAHGLIAAVSPEQAIADFSAPAEAEKAMHGLRPLDQASLARFRDDPGKMAYLASIRPQLEPLLDWTRVRFGYDVAI